MTMTLEQCLTACRRNRLHDAADAIDAAIRERDELRESLRSRTAHITIPTEAMQQECVAYARPFKDRAEKAEGDCNDLRKRLNDAISERNTIRRERAQEHRKHARERAEFAALKARIADGWLCGVSNDKCSGNFDAAIYRLPSRFRGMRVRLLVED